MQWRPVATVYREFTTRETQFCKEALQTIPEMYFLMIKIPVYMLVWRLVNIMIFICYFWDIEIFHI